MANRFQSLVSLIRCPIIQFGPPRTGSTLVWNALRTAFPLASIPKRHHLNRLELASWFPAKIVCTVRNPLDAIASSIQRYQLEPTESVIDQQIREFDLNGMKEVVLLGSRRNTLILRYEEYVNNFEFLFDRIECFFDHPVDADTRARFQDRFSISAVQRKSDAMGDFANFDREDQIHGRHISKFKGRPGYYTEVLTELHVARIRNHFRNFFEIYGY
jgi:hypothetical protein